MTPDRGFTQVPKEFTKDTRLSPAARLTGEIILGFQFQDGVTYVTQDRIAERLGQSPRQTRKHLNQLENLGWVSVERRRKPDGTWHSNRYSFCAEPIQRDSSSDGVPMDPAIGTGVPMDTAVGTPVFAGQNQRNPSEAKGTVVPHTNNISSNKGASDGKAVAALTATPAPKVSKLNPPQSLSPFMGLHKEAPSHRNSSSYGEVPRSYDVALAPPEEEDDDCQECRDPSTSTSSISAHPRTDNGMPTWRG
jgi:Helix-turn-helix domain